jgi:hypothetical protein
MIDLLFVLFGDNVSVICGSYAVLNEICGRSWTLSWEGFGLFGIAMLASTWNK